jgi:hypothetical protein
VDIDEDEMMPMICLNLLYSRVNKPKPNMSCFGGIGRFGHNPGFRHFGGYRPVLWIWLT